MASILKPMKIIQKTWPAANAASSPEEAITSRRRTIEGLAWLMDLALVKSGPCPKHAAARGSR